LDLHKHFIREVSVTRKNGLHFGSHLLLDHEALKTEQTSTVQWPFICLPVEPPHPFCHGLLMTSLCTVHTIN